MNSRYEVIHDSMMMFAGLAWTQSEGWPDERAVDQFARGYLDFATKK